MQPVLVLVIVALEVVLLRRWEVWGQISAGLAARIGLL
jgi:hypothetical protein